MTTTALRAIAAECRKGLLITWYYRFNILMQMVTVSIIFLFVLLVAGHGSLDTTATSSAMLGYAVWIFAVNVIGGTGSELVAEAQAGTLEQMCMAVAPTELLLAGRALASLISTTVQLALFDLALYLLLDRTIPVSPSGLVVLVITLFGLFGFGLLLGGATLIFKNVQALSNLIVNLFIFVNGTLLSVSNFPRWLEILANSLPSTQGVTLLKRTVTGGESLGSGPAARAVLGLVINSAIYFALGWVLFELGARVARKRGTLGQY